MQAAAATLTVSK